MGAGGAADRRYQVFISSTFLDLQPERQEVIQALLELDCFPAGMELFPASNDERWELIKSVIDDSDYYLVIVGGRYGSTDEEGISYTEKEFDYAVSVKKPVIGFVHSDPDELPKKFTEGDPDLQKKLDAFRDKVEKRIVKRWKSPEELGSAVSRSLVKLIKSEPATGWVRADAAITPELIEEMASLRSQIAEFKAERSRTSAPAGTEEFAQGEDEVTLEYTYNYAEPGEYTGSTYAAKATVTWDDIFRVVGPTMFDEAPEATLRQRVDNLIRDFERPALRAAHGGAGRLTEFRVSQQSFDKVKVQLVALRLIEKSNRNRSVKDKATYWQLTPYGETYVMRLHAVRRAEPDKSLAAE